MGYLLSVACALSGLVNALLAGHYPETICMRIRRYKLMYKGNWPKRLLPFYAIERVVTWINKAHLEKSWVTAKKELDENLLKGFKNCKKN